MSSMNVSGRQMVEYIADYLENIRERRVFPAVKPGYIRELVPDHAPLEPEHWDTIFTDIERVIMPGVSHSSVEHGDQGTPRGDDVSVAQWRRYKGGGDTSPLPPWTWLP